MYEIKTINNPEVWEKFVLAQPHTLFVQSSHYGDFYRALGEEAWIFGLFDKENLVGGSLIVSVHAKRGNFLYVPYGPILPEHELKQALAVWTNAAQALGQSQAYDFLRISPFLDDTNEYRAIFSKQKFRLAPMHMIAETTWLLELDKSNANLLAAMNKNHRNLIRRCESGGVRVEKTSHPEALKGFNDLFDATAKRHKFHRFSRAYIEQEFFAFARHDEAVIFNAYLPDGALDSSAIIIYYGNLACYRHGASIGRDSRLPTSYLLQWQAIQEAKRRGLRYYNFWGVAPAGARPSHPFYGLTHFKKGFGGTAKNLVPCLDLPLTRAYWINWIWESARHLKRGF